MWRQLHEGSACRENRTRSNTRHLVPLIGMSLTARQNTRARAHTSATSHALVERLRDAPHLDRNMHQELRRHQERNTHNGRAPAHRTSAPRLRSTSLLSPLSRNTLATLKTRLPGHNTIIYASPTAPSSRSPTSAPRLPGTSCVIEFRLSLEI